MKTMKSIIVLMCLLFPLLALSQTEIPYKKIEVTGEAEMEVTPDEIFVRITLKEYLDGRKKVSMDKLEARLVKAVSSEGLTETDLTIENIFGYNWNWKKQRSEEFLASKSFRLKIGDLKKINNLLERLDERGVNNVAISGYTHSNLKDYQQDLKLQALKNAKQQAAFLLQGIDEELGPVIEIQEHQFNRPQQVRYQSNTLEAADASSYQSNLEFKTMKLQSRIRAVFSIK